MIFADLHFHSKYSRATSPRNELKTLSEWAKIKGINVLGSTDFTHPKWFAELKEKLTPFNEEQGTIYKYNGTKYVLSTEIATIYPKSGKSRKVHHVILAPSLEVVEQINDVLGKRANLMMDGRLIIKMSCPELVETVTQFSDLVEVIPAHIWTPWFGLFGSKSGFDTIEDAYEDQTHKIHALETGLSSDIKMNCRLSSLDKYALISNSDAHSPENLGRELTTFNINPEKLTYNKMINAIKSKDIGTVEFYPEEGKYHWDGHRKCNTSFKPSDSLKHNNICPVCHRPLTLGVEHRVEELADRPEGFIPKNPQTFEYIIPLREIISDTLGISKISKKVQIVYSDMIKQYGTEWNVLHTNDLSKMQPLIAQAIKNYQQGKIKIVPGYDGEYGVIDIEKEQTTDTVNTLQKSLTEF